MLNNPGINADFYDELYVGKWGARGTKLQVEEIVEKLNTYHQELKAKAIKDHEYRVVMEKDFDKFLKERQQHLPMPMLLALQGLI